MQKLDELGGSGRQGLFSKASDIPAALDGKMFDWQDSQCTIAYLALHGHLGKNAHTKPSRHSAFDSLDMSEYHPNLQRHPGLLKQLFHRSPRPRAYLAQ